MKAAKPIKKSAGRTIPENLWFIVPVIITAVFFLPVVGFDVLNWDDRGYLAENPLLGNFSLKRLFTMFWMGNYHPLTMLFFTLGFKTAGMSGPFFHLLNLAIHLMNVWLVFMIAARLLGNKYLPAALTALLFGIHPMHIESVAWISELKDVLYALFFLLSWYVYIIYARKGGAVRLLLALGLFILSLLSKGQAVVLTPVIILTDIFLKRKFTLKVIAEKIPFLALSIFFGILALKAQQSVSALSYGMVEPQKNYLFGFYNYLLYLIRVVWPGALSGVHPYAVPSAITLYSALILFAGLIAAAFLAVRKTGPVTLFGVMFFVLTMSITVKFIPVGEQMISERYSYIPYIGLFMIISEAFHRIWIHPKFRITGAILLGAWLITLAVAGFSYLRTYKNSETYWKNVVKHYPGYWRPHYSLALYFGETERPEAALEHNTLAIRLAPAGNAKELANLYTNRASLFINKFSDYRNALPDYRKVISYDSARNDVLIYAGYCCVKLDSVAEARKMLEKFISRDTTNSYAYYYLSFADKKSGLFEEARLHLDKAIRIRPDMSDARFQRGMLCTENLSRHEEALDDFRYCANTGYKAGEAFINMAVCSLRLSRYGDVVAFCDQAMAAGGDKGSAWYFKAVAYEKMGRFADAFKAGQEAQRAGRSVSPAEMRHWQTKSGS